MKEIINILLSSVKPDFAALRSMLFRLLILLVVLCISSVITVLGLGFLVWSLYLYLETLFTPYQAALISGSAVIILAVGIVLIALLLTGHSRMGGRAKTKPQPAQAGLESDPLELVYKYPLESGLTAAIAGFIVGSSSDAPRTLAEFLTLLKQSGSK